MRARGRCREGEEGHDREKLMTPDREEQRERDTHIIEKRDGLKPRGEEDGGIMMNS